MTEEITTLENNQAQTLTDLPIGKKTICFKWVYRVKHNSDGAIQCNKARLVIRDDHQIERFDYDETFAPVARMNSVRCFLEVAFAKRWDLDQMDINNTVLDWDLEEEVYMKLPLGLTAQTLTRHAS